MKKGLEAIDYSINTGYEIYYNEEPVIAKCYHWEKVRRKGEDKIWQREDEKTELTLQEIADKFDVPVEHLRIKE